MKKQSKTIIATLWGGIGNQLFIYAANRRLSVKSGFNLYLDDESGFLMDRKYKRSNQLDNFLLPFYNENKFLESKKKINHFERNIKKQVNKILPLNYRNYLIQNRIDFDNRILKIKPSRSLRIEGYWQSEDYFIDVENIIRNDLKYKKEINQKNNLNFAKINVEDSVAIHLREPNKNLISLETRDLNKYYIEAINYIRNKLSNPKFFVFGENKTIKIKEYLSSNNAIFISNPNPIDDLYLMSSCKHFIIADSSFSWWGAWLSENNTKIVIAPNYNDYQSERLWGFKGHIPQNWKLI